MQKEISLFLYLGSDIIYCLSDAYDLGVFDLAILSKCLRINDVELSVVMLRLILDRGVGC